MTKRNIFDELTFEPRKVEVIDLTDDIEDDDDDVIEILDDLSEVRFEDSFSENVGTRLLENSSITSILSNWEVFSLSNHDYLELNRYEAYKDIPNYVNVKVEEIQINDSSGPQIKDSSIENQISPISNEYSSYYLIKKTFKCPSLLIDNLIDKFRSVINSKSDDDDVMNCPSEIEIEAEIETSEHSSIITKRDLRLTYYYEMSRAKKIKRTVKAALPESNIIEISDSEDDQSQNIKSEISTGNSIR